jgi:hypothetical protein
MFDRLISELARIRTRKFHIVDGSASPELREAIEKSGMALPPSFKAFVIHFGNAQLYRRANYHLIEIVAGPKTAIGDGGEALIQFGRTHTSFAYFKESLLVSGHESPVFEWHHGQGLRKTAEGFLEWIESKLLWARKQYSNKEWKQIEEGPPPFNEQELTAVKARKAFRWKVVGIGPNQDLRFEIHNGSHQVLKYLSVGVRGTMRKPNSGLLDGIVYLPVVSVRPGRTEVIEYDCYKEYVAPENAEVFDLPEPGPEDRSVYWEFRGNA